MKRIITTTVIIAVIGLLSASTCLAGTLLRMQFKPGDITKYYMTMNLDSRVVQKGNIPIQLVKPTLIEATGVVTLEVTGVNDKDMATVKMAMPEMNALQDGKPMPKSMAASNGMPGIDITSMLSKDMTLGVDNRNQVIELPKPDESKAASPFDFDALTKQLLNAALALPEAEVEPGDTWSNDVTVNLPIFPRPITISVFGSLEDIVDNVAEVSTEVTITESDLKINLAGLNLPSTGANMTAGINKIDLKMKLVRKIDLEKGKMSDLTMDVDGNIDVYGGMESGSSAMKAQIAGDIKSNFALTAAD
jgi:hypothetical protein